MLIVAFAACDEQGEVRLWDTAKNAVASTKNRDYDVGMVLDDEVCGDALDAFGLANMSEGEVKQINVEVLPVSVGDCPICEGSGSKIA